MKTKYHSILFSTPMVQAILEDRKTQTRRTKGLEEINKNSDDWRLLNSFDKPEDDQTAFYIRNNNLYVQFTNGHKNLDIKCPYNVDDVFWVRETSHDVLDSETLEFLRYGYKANNDYPGAKWRPSIFMPKEACRIFLKIKSIRIERLQEISEEDAIAEGAKNRLKHNDLKVLEGLRGWPIPRPFLEHQFGFLAVWCTINGCDNWIQSPFVWLYEFERIEKPLDFC
ncbi:hypothetical protein [Flavobacterium sp.]|uniref:hypothetical protein n=1 Tax=Flavobacterium sp. TaxID=239 RepID=UPI002B9EBB3B|nr:hypothetical protein [Flavobacterium sp.]HSD07921.1 hypothetical protein [Flavobacterium sp.]